MRLYLVQHGEAAPKEVDPERPLTEKGKQDATKIAELLKESQAAVDIIIHSLKKRAAETATIFAGQLSPREGTEQKEGFAPNDPVDKRYNEVKSRDKDVMIVGHLPFLAKLASLALTGSEFNEIVGFRQGGVVCIERTETENWQLIFAVTPDLLK